MKTLYYLKHIIAVTALLLTSMIGFSQIATSVGTPVLSGGVYSVPVNVTNFTGVGSISLKISYDVTKLTYTGIQLNAGILPANNPVTTPTSDVTGQISVSYVSSAAITLTEGANAQLLTLTFTAKPGFTGSNTPLNWSVHQGDCEYASPAGVIVSGSTFLNGSVPPEPTIIGPNTVCSGSSDIYTTESGKNSYVWTVVGGTISAGQGTNAITVTSATAFTVQVAYTDPVSGSALVSPVKSVTLNTAVTPSLVGPTSVCVGSTHTFTTDAGMSGYVWTIPVGVTVNGANNQNTISLTFTTAGAPSIGVTYTQPTGCTVVTPTTNLSVTVNPLPVPVITGPASVCINSTGNVYSTASGMSGYVWTVSAGGIITAGGQSNSNSVTVTWNTVGAQTVSVNYVNATGCSAAAATGYPVTVNPLPVPTITGSLIECVGSTGNIYTTEPGMTGYVWTVPATALIVSGQGTRSITVNWNAVGDQVISVTYVNPNLCSPVNPTTATVAVHALPVPTITGPMVLGFPASISNGVTTGQVYKTEKNKVNYVWTVSAAGTITAGGTATDSTVTVTWTNPTGHQSVSVNYSEALVLCPAATPTVYLVNYSPFPAEIDPTTIPKFVDALPHFAAGLRVNAKAGGSLLIKAVPVQQIALSTGTVLATGTITNAPGSTIGMGAYAAYAISQDGGTTFGPAMWPAQTIEAMQGNQLLVTYRNDLFGVTYANFNILADQTLMMNGYTLNGNPLTDPYTGPIPMVVHLHGGEMPSNSDGGPTAWFTPGYAQVGPGFDVNASGLSTYPNQQEGTTLWYHPHDQGLTRINVYTGLAGFYFLRGKYEDAMHLPGWSGDDKVIEVQPVDQVTDAITGSRSRTAPFNSPTPQTAVAYLPEIELAVQDRMFNVNGGLFWPVAPTNPDIHPFWTPEFFGDVMTVNGKSWPYLSVAPRKYAFRLLNGCNARFLNMWLQDLANASNGPKITVVATEGGFLDNPVDIAPGQKLFLAPAERPIIVIDFSGVPAGTVFTLMNDAPAPYPTGSPVIAGLTDRIMQFVVNGQMVSAANPANPGTDKSAALTPSTNLRPSLPMVKLSNFTGGTTVTPNVKRQLILNEITGLGGPLMVAINNSHFDAGTPLPGVVSFGGPTEVPQEGTTEMWQIINTTVDAHPMHIHLTQWQLVSRQDFDVVGYMTAYANAWATRGVPNYPSFSTYPGGAGSPNPYDVMNSDGAVGGNPAVSTFLTPGTLTLPLPYEKGWKDLIKALPGQVSTYICRLTPTDVPLNATADKLVYPFDPSLGPGYVWHCHIIDHEDMDMMRPLPIAPSAQRYPVITVQPALQSVCAGDNTTFSVTATSATAMTYQWQFSANGTAAWANVVDGVPGPYANSTTATLNINPAAIGLSATQYRCLVTNIDGTTTSNAVALTVNNCTISGTLMYNNPSPTVPLQGMTVTANGKSAVVAANGSYTITGVNSGTQTVTVTPSSQNYVSSINSTDAGAALYWFNNLSAINQAKFLAGEVTGDNTINAADALAIQNYFVFNTAMRSVWSFGNAATMISANPGSASIQVPVNGNSIVLNLLGAATGDFNGSFNPLLPKSGASQIQLTYGDTRKIGPNQDFELPIKAVSAMEVGAVSLILNIPSDLIDVRDVYMKNSKDKLSFSVSGNELRIGWNSLTPMSLQDASDMIVLKLKTTSALTDGKTIKVTLASNPLNEVANGSFNVIPNAVLKTDILLGMSERPLTVSLTGYPNPFSDFTTINYTLPSDANVTLQIYNLLGASVKTLVNEHQSSGTYTLRMDASKMTQGAYYGTLRVNDGNKVVERTIKLVLNK